MNLVSYSLIYHHGRRLIFIPLELQSLPNHAPLFLFIPTIQPALTLARMNAESSMKYVKRQGLALIIDEVFLDYAHSKPQPTFATNRRCTQLHAKRDFKNFCPAANEAGMDYRKRTACGSCSCDAAARNSSSDTYLYFECADSTGRAHSPRSEKGHPAATHAAGPRQSGRPSIANSRLRNLALVSKFKADGMQLLRIPVIRADGKILLLNCCGDLACSFIPGHFYDFVSDG